MHKFYESDHPLYFSTKLFDVKCSPLFFKCVLKLPQMARVYLDANAELASSLHNLSTVMFTSFSQGHNLKLRKVSDTGDDLGPAFTIPLNTKLKVNFIQWKLWKWLKVKLLCFFLNTAGGCNKDTKG